MNESVRVLIVDDDLINRTLLSYGVQQHGYIGVAAEGGSEALTLLRAEPFDVVLLDLLMPEMDGFQVLEAIKSDPALRGVPVIMVSAMDELESVVRCIEMGAADYLPKPCNPVLLKARVEGSVAQARWRAREHEYLQQVQCLAAATAEARTNGSARECLSEVARRPDAVGELARVLLRRAAEM